MRRAVFVKDKLNKHSIRALICAFEKWFPERDYAVLTPEDALKSFRSGDLAMISFATGRSAFYKEYANAIKSLNKDINTICGGAHPSARSEDMLNYFDAVCTGEGEISLKEFVETADDSRIEGIITGKRAENLDDFHVFPRKKIVLGPVEIMRGCPSGCAYCQTPQLFKGKLRFRSVDTIIEEMRFALSRKGFADARFIAPDAAAYQWNGGVNLDAIELLLKSVRTEIGATGKLFFGTFPSELDPSGVTKELVELLTSYCDNKLIVLGLQSASERMQKVMRRRSGVEDTERAIELLLDKNFEIVIDLIFGLPYEDEKSYDDTYKFIERWKGRVTIHAHPFDCLPGSLWEYEEGTQVPEKLVKLVKSLEGIGRVFGHTVKCKDGKCHA